MSAATEYRKVVVYFRDGEPPAAYAVEATFAGTGGLTVRYDPNSVAVITVHGHETAYPLDRVKQVACEALPRRDAYR
jgi:hypothetical protein